MEIYSFRYKLIHREIICTADNIKYEMGKCDKCILTEC